MAAAADEHRTPDPQVEPRATTRRFPVAYKQRKAADVALGASSIWRTIVVRPSRSCDERLTAQPHAHTGGTTRVGQPTSTRSSPNCAIPVTSTSVDLAHARRRLQIADIDDMRSRLVTRPWELESGSAQWIVDAGLRYVMPNV